MRAGEGGKHSRLICRRSELNDLRRQLEVLKESNDDERLEAFHKKCEREKQQVDTVRHIKFFQQSF